jgi:hypothetical protein
VTQSNGFLKTCEHCGVQFYVQLHRKDRVRFCSLSCLYVGRRTKPRSDVEVICEFCGRTYNVRQYRKGVTRFCSKSCAANGTAVARVEIRRDGVGWRTYPDKRMTAEEWKIKLHFHQHKYSAKIRGIEFLFSFEEWLTTWLESSHFEERGQGAGKFCMARKGDVGPYSKENVRIITNAENLAERVLPKGEFVHNSKLSTKDVLFIRENEGIIARKDLAIRFDIRHDHVRDIQKRKSWAWLP